MENIEDIYDLSPMQQGMLFHTLYAPESGIYFEQTIVTLDGPLNKRAFKQAWQQLIDGHPVLRTEFYWEQLDKPLQVVRKKVSLPWHQQDWQKIVHPEQELQNFLAADRERGFELDEAPLMRCALMQIESERHYFVWSYHHLLLDGWSTSLLVQEVWSAYRSACEGKWLFRARPRLYKHYIAWLQQQDLAQAEAYWRQTLEGFTAPTPLIDHHTRVNDQKGYSEHRFYLSAKTSSALQKIARDNRLTLNTVIQGAWAVLLSRYSGEEDVLFGATVSGRPAELRGVETMIGLFINTLPVRVNVPANLSLLAWLSNLQEQQREREQYAYSSLIDIQGWSEVPRGMPLFESLLVYENYPAPKESSEEEADLRISNISSVEQTNYPLTLVALLTESDLPAAEQDALPSLSSQTKERAQLYFAIGYDTSRFDDETTHRMAEHLQTFLTNVVANPNQPLAHLSLLTEREKHQLLVEWNDTQTDYPTNQCIHHLFEEQVERTPDAVAVIFGDQTLTYRELNTRANQLAHYLIKQGIGGAPGEETLVGICLERSLEMVVGLLATLKAGGAYVPLDPTYPADRLAFMFSDAQVKLILTQAGLIERLSMLHDAGVASKETVLDLNNNWPRIALESPENPQVEVQPANLAYIIYTSGSTGRPKGVMIPHRAICNHMFWIQNTFAITASDKVLQKTPFSFDASVWEFYAPLLVGGQLVMARPFGHQDSTYMGQILQSEEITILQLVPTQLRMLVEAGNLEQCRSLRHLFCGGEALPVELIRRFKSLNGAQLTNLYGPTEACIDATFWTAKHETEIVPIGRPISNVQAYILDKHLQLVPIGVAGELYLSGAGLARGYLNRPQLSKEKFIPNPFAHHTPACGSKLYKTGDLCRYLPDTQGAGSGDIEFLGRTDYQVKVRGYRIELGEIEAVLTRQPNVREAVVVVREQATGKRLVAYIVTASSKTASSKMMVEDGVTFNDDVTFELKEAGPTSVLRAYLREKLPDYMIPSTFVSLEAMPLTPNGKIDRRALPAPEDSDLISSAGFIAPRNQTEQELVHIWLEVLGVHSVGIRDSFFDLGGHSLLAVQLMAQIQQHFDVNLPLATLFQSPTIEQLATQLNQPKEAADWSALVPIQPHGDNLPFFCVPGAGGNVIYFYDLARFMGAQQPFYGLQAVGLDGQTTPYSTVEAIAAHYIEVILHIQPQGPYLLGGHSFGGTVVFEMAQQLLSAGHEVANLIILDTPAPTEHTESEQATWDNAKWLVSLIEIVGALTGEEMALSYEGLLSFDPEEQLIRFKEELESLNLLPKNSDLNQVRGWVQVLKTNTLMNYMPRAIIPTPITLFQAFDSQSEQQDPTWGWNEFAKGPVEVISVPGDHMTMMTRPHVEVLAKQLRECLHRI